MPSENLKNNYPSLEDLLAALTTQPDDPTLHHALAQAYAQIHNVTAAISHYQKSLGINPLYAEAHNSFACLLTKLGDYQQALLHYREAVHAAPDYLEAHYNLGLLLLKKQLFEAASVQFNNVLTLAPEHIQARFYLGMMQLQSDQLDKAQETLEAVVEQDPEHCDALNNLGVIALKKNHGQLAVHYFTQVIALNNNHQEARNNLAATFLAHDRFENALIHYRELLKIDAENIEYLYNAAIALMTLGQIAEAKQFFERILTIQPQHAATYNNLAALAMRSNNKSQALAYLQQAVTLNPLDHTSKHMLQAIEGNSLAATTPSYAQNLFDNYAFYYDEHLQKKLQYTLPERLLTLINQSNLKPPLDILDLGCGTGLCGEKFKSLSKKICGVDISTKMIEKARQKKLYDRLEVDNIEHFLETDQDKYDLIIAADVFPYFGDLKPLFNKITQRLLPSGLFIFTTEISENQPWQLQPNARFSHHLTYIKKLCASQNWQIHHYEKIIARHQDTQPVWVHCMLLSYS